MVPKSHFLTTIPLPTLHASGALDLDRPFTNELPPTIHPLFRPSRFPTLPSPTFALLLPSLQLATRLIAEPVFLPFFFALLHPSRRRRIRSQDLELEYGRACWRFDLKPGGINEKEMRWTAGMLGRLAGCVRWRFGAARGYYGITRQCGELPGLRNSTTGAEVELSSEYLEVLKRYAAQTERQRTGYTPPLTDDPAAEDLTEASILRTRFHLAKTIVHEVCHAIKWAVTLPQLTSEGEWELPYEPFFMDQRIAEVGAAWESVVFGGIVNPLREDVDARWGLGIEKWPKYWDDSTGLNRAPSRRTHNITYIVPTPYLHSLWTAAFWLSLPLSGLSALHPPKTLGVSEAIPNTNFPGREWQEYLSDTETVWSRRSERVRQLERRMRSAVRRDCVLEGAAGVGEGAGMEEISEDSSVGRVFRGGIWRAGEEESEGGEVRGQRSPARAVRRRSLRNGGAAAGMARVPRRSRSPKAKYARGTPYGKM
ncbi:hypothetical protein H2201_003060 [Coniosporium apollinis]|uniref:SprT-like domain-containing protein n=1 Tax=Coniosporium apollinis TaxID=61459 RepID=A0ABQ9NYZ5_9PEZI|nr:hypothetical protein H2201_003060 [Coniosporium apollinis]